MKIIHQPIKKRQAIVEHLYGTIKRQRGFSYISTKKYKIRASADVGLMFVAYNIRRIMSVLSKSELTKCLKEVLLLFLIKIHQIRLQISNPDLLKIQDKIIGSLFQHPSKSLIFGQLLIESNGF